MANTTRFTITRGTLESDCLPKTQDFIEQNLAFFYSSISGLTDTLDDSGAVTFVSCEDQWSFACKVERAELGNIATANGVVSEGGRSRFDELVGELS